MCVIDLSIFCAKKYPPSSPVHKLIDTAAVVHTVGTYGIEVQGKVSQGASLQLPARCEDFDR